MSVTTPPELGAPPGPEPVRLVRSELLKIRTTHVWWIFLIGVFAATALAATVWIASGDFEINEAEAASGEVFEPPEGANEATVELAREQFELRQDLTRTLHDVAAEIYTSGQFFGLMFALLLGTLLVTNEYHHQTATSTFLTTPRRTRVVLSKLATAMLGAGFFWLFTTALGVAAGALFLAAKGYGTQLDQWPVIRAILFNGLAYGLWGILGVGVGVLLRSQIAAVLVGAIGYVVGSVLIQQALIPIAYFLGWDWVVDASVAWPSVASVVMINPEPPYPDAPQWWVGAVVLVGWGIVTGVIGTLVTRRRDIS